MPESRPTWPLCAGGLIDYQVVQHIPVLVQVAPL